MPDNSDATASADESVPVIFKRLDADNDGGLSLD